MTNQLVRTAVALLAVALLSAGCSDSEGNDESAQPSQQPSGSAAGAEPSEELTVIEPGQPGEVAATNTAGSDVTAPAQQDNAADVLFVEMMIPHHQQALEMSRLARTNAEDRSVRKLAARIRGAQGPEILMMTGWLEERGLAVPEAGSHEHEEMEGMLSDKQMADLAAARGKQFDRLFLEGMIQHHLGAIAMADVVTVEGINIRISELAADINAGQNAEIARMEDVLAQL